MTLTHAWTEMLNHMMNVPLAPNFKQIQHIAASLNAMRLNRTNVGSFASLCFFNSAETRRRRSPRMKKGPTRISTAIAGFRVQSANRYTIGPTDAIIDGEKLAASISGQTAHTHPTQCY